MEEEHDYWETSVKNQFDFNYDEELPIKSTNTDHKLFQEDNVSEWSYELPTNNIPLTTLISQQDLRTILEEQSMEEATLPKSISMEDELKILRRKVKEYIHAPPASIVITKMLMKKPFSLESFKSLQDKEDLLDEAIQSGNGDAILTVILFLVKTLKKSHVCKLVQHKPEAIQHYVNYLMTRLQLTECSEWLILLGKHKESALLQFRMNSNLQRTPQIKKEILQKIQTDYFLKYDLNIIYIQILKNYLNLLDCQWKEEQTSSVNNLFDTSTLKYLYYVCTKHKWGTNDTNSIINPYKLMESFKISQSQFEWIALNERAKSQAWRDLETLFEKKSWHSFKTKTFSITLPLDRVILQLYNYEAPVPILEYFLLHVSDVQRRLALAKKMDVTRTIVDALVEQKDKQQLEVLIESLTIGTNVRFYAENALKVMNSKWKADSIKINRT